MSNFLQILIIIRGKYTFKMKNDVIFSKFDKILSNCNNLKFCQFFMKKLKFNKKHLNYKVNMQLKVLFL